MGAGITILEEASMTTVTRADLTEAAAVKGAVEKEEARDRVDQCLATISDALVAGDRVGINGFGSFEVRQKPAQVDRNPKHLDEWPDISSATFPFSSGLARNTTTRRAVMTCVSLGSLGFRPIRSDFCRTLNEPNPD